MPKVLIQLIGGQTLPNIFPILAVRPERVVNIYTASTEKQHHSIVDWFSQFGKKHKLRPQFAEYSPIPDKDLTLLSKAINSILQREYSLMKETPGTMMILNMTGGTKPMSAYAMSSCMNMSRILTSQDGLPPVPIIYLNSTTDELEFISHSDLKEQVVAQPYENISLGAGELIAAGGNAVLLSAHYDWQKDYPAAVRIQQIASSGVYFQMKNADRDNYLSFVQSSLSDLMQDDKADRRAKATEQLKKLATKVQETPELAESFQRRGLVARDGDFYFSEHLQIKAQKLANNDKLRGNIKYEKLKEMIYCLQEATNFFVGGWWEVIVAHAYQLQNPTAEVLWSAVTAPVNNPKLKVETDVIASNGHSLCCISCKRGVHAQDKVTQELEQHCTRTAQLSGVIHRRIIAVFRKESEAMLKGLADALRLTMWSFQTVRDIEYKQLIPEQKPEVKAEQKPEPKPEPKPAVKVVPAAPSFGKRLIKAFRYIFSGKM